MQLIRFSPCLIVILAGCVDDSEFEGELDGALGPETGGESCSAGQSRCVGQSYQTCQDGFYKEIQTCQAPRVCVPERGCLECDPVKGKGCVGNNVHACNPDGTLGAEIERCLGRVCAAGLCTDPSCTVGARVVYVVDSEYRLLSFDPSKEDNPFTLIAKLQCPAGSPWPPSPAPATPFSMSVDRSARAWVLYTSGEIFWVDTKDGKCEASPFVKGQEGYKLFGMGFVVDTAGGSKERLFVSRAKDPGSLLPGAASELGYIDMATLKLHKVQAMEASENSPELTGTGNAELFGYFPGSTESFVAQLDKKTGKPIKKWKVDPLKGQVSAWAFAHWGGKYYVFVTDRDAFGLAETNHVFRLDPKDGSYKTFLAKSPYRIVGAGVSTCAPVID
jgi:hypothetical protein